MVYGYDSHLLNDYGLRQMREVSISASSEDLRRLASFITCVADELDAAEARPNLNWHRHAPGDLREFLGCDFVICSPEEA